MFFLEGDNNPMEVGEKKNRLTLVEKFDKYRKILRNPNWKQVVRMGNFLCDCGNHINAEIYSVAGKRGNTKSCGCLQKEYANSPHKHGRSKRHNKNYHTYSSWQHMKDRCLNPNNKYYKNYGGRGITICDRWINSFENFLEDMGDREKYLSLDRVDNSKGYSKENCKLSTRKEQANNTRRNK